MAMVEPRCRVRLLFIVIFINSSANKVESQLQIGRQLVSSDKNNYGADYQVQEI
jgi:hypothetical protein